MHIRCICRCFFLYSYRLLFSLHCTACSKNDLYTSGKIVKVLSPNKKYLVELDGSHRTRLATNKEIAIPKVSSYSKKKKKKKKKKPKT